MQKKDISKKIAVLLLFCLILFHLINNYVVLINNKAPFYSDSAHYISESYERYKSINQHQYLEAYRTPPAWSYPILYQLFSVPFYFVFGIGTTAATMTNSIFLIILVFSVYGIGHKLHSRKAGLLAAFMITSFPHVFSLSRTYLFDFPLLATVSLSVLCLFKTENFKNRKGSILFGLAVGFSALMKPYFIIFLISPLLIYLYYSFVKESNAQTQKFNNLILAFIAALGLGMLGYLPPHLGSILVRMKGALYYKEMHNFTFYDNIIYYIRELRNVQIFPFYFLLFLFSLRMFFINKYKSLFLFSWFFVPYLFFTFVMLNNKNPRFIVPCLPAIALLISLNIFLMKHSIIKKLIVILVIIMGFSQFFVVSYYLDDRALHLLSPDFRFSPDRFPDWGYGIPFAYPSDWGINSLKNLIKDSLKPDTKMISILDFYNYPDVSSPFVYILPEDLGITVDGIYTASDKGVMEGDTKLLMVDYIVFPKEEYTKEEYNTPVSKEEYNKFLARESVLIKISANFKGIKNIGNIKLPDGTILFVYQVEK